MLTTKTYIYLDQKKRCKFFYLLYKSLMYLISFFSLYSAFLKKKRQDRSIINIICK